MVWANYMSPCNSTAGLYFEGTQGLKLTFLGERQLATEIFFHSPDGKMCRQKGSIKLFLRSETKMDRKV